MDKNIPIYKNCDFSEINTLTLVIGTKCNMFCRHCSQLPIKCFSDLNLVCSAKVWRILSNFILSNKNAKQQRQIVLWGGEPLVYWDFIKELVLRVEKELNAYSGQGFIFSFVTNGLLLDEEKVDFINKHHIKVGFSYDAPYPFAVRGYVSDEICELVNRIDNCSIEANCGNKYNCDLLLSYECIKRKFPNVKNCNITEKLIYSFSMDSDIYDYDWQQIKDNYRKLRISAQMGNTFSLERFLRYFKKQVEISSSNEIGSVKVIRCPKIDTEFSVTLDGKISFCGNGNFYFSTVDNSWNDFLKNNFNYVTTVKSVRCDTCRHSVDFCWKQCLLNLQDKDGNFIICDKCLIPLYDIIKQELLNLSKPLTKEEIAWYKEQEKVMEQQVQAFLLEGKRYEKEHTRLPK